MKANRHRPLPHTWTLLVLTIFISSLLLPAPVPGRASAPTQMHMTYLPAVSYDSGYPRPFGAEWNRSSALMASYVQHAKTIGLSWTRLHRISWRAIQPNEGDPYNWTVLAAFEAEILATRAAGLMPMVVVHHSPLWATLNDPFPTDCGAVRADKLPAFADFMSALVARYKQPPFDIHYWELGNEPDVDPILVPADWEFGCWGDIDDPYYGGRHYGEMLKVITPAIRAADPAAKVVIGGLLLDRPVPQPGAGNPQRFLEGILLAGAAPYLDIVAYHAYPSYTGTGVDYDLSTGLWGSWGGWTLGKARFLRQVLASFGVSKPLILNEAALTCNPDWYACDPPGPEFFQEQADYLVRTFARARSEDISGFVWYTLNGPGWRSTGLLDGTGLPRPAYWAYQQLAAHLNRSLYEGAVAYGGDVEAYSFVRAKDRVHVAWSLDHTAESISVPQSAFVAAYDRDGTQLTPVAASPYYQLSVGFSPIYVVLKK